MCTIAPLEFRSWQAMLLPGIFAVLAACAAPSRELSHVVPDYVSLANGNNPLAPTEPSQMLQELGGESFFSWLERRKNRPLNILQVSGGGQNGAFTVGVLKGWQESGSMPSFDIVTGISVGALVATFAFLGDAEATGRVANVFTSISQADISRRKGKLSVVFGGDAFLDNAPLAHLIEKTVTDEIIEQVAAAYREQQRYLFIGVLNLDYRQLWVFNLTALAASQEPNRHAVYRRLLLAASAVPLAFSPVEIDGHLFADGGTKDRLLVAGLDRNAGRMVGRGGYRKGHIYVLFNDQVRSAPVAAQRDVKRLAASAVNAMLDGQMESTILRSYVAALAHGYEFRLLQIPDSFAFQGDGLTFSPADMQGLFRLGRSLGAEPSSWLTAPEAGQTVGSGVIEALEDLVR